MPPKKKVQETKGPIEIILHPTPAFAYESELPELRGYSFVGKDAETALINAKAFLNHYYKVRGYWPIFIGTQDDNDD